MNIQACTGALAIVFMVGCASRPAAPAVGAPSAALATTSSAEKVRPPPGYRIVERNSETLYCTRVALLGTNFKQDVCMTAAEYKEVRRRGDNAAQDLGRSVKICGIPPGDSSCSGGL